MAQAQQEATDLAALDAAYTEERDRPLRSSRNFPNQGRMIGRVNAKPTAKVFLVRTPEGLVAENADNPSELEMFSRWAQLAEEVLAQRPVEGHIGDLMGRGIPMRGRPRLSSVKESNQSLRVNFVLILTHDGVSLPAPAAATGTEILLSNGQVWQEGLQNPVPPLVAKAIERCAWM